jgi:glycosyltransferase involved in cell wall biosynthesis
LRLKLGKNVKIILLHRAERPFGRVKKYLQKLADKCVDAYLFTTSAFSNDWRMNIDVKKIHEVIQASSVFYTLDRTEAVKGTGIKGPLVFLWVGSLIPRKDPLTVVKAFLEFARYRPESKMYMIYQSAELLQEINTLLDGNKKYREAIVLVGKVSHDQLLYWYNSADFFISASQYEGSGVAVSEAMSCGCIPITSDFITFQKMTGPGKCGLLFETGNDKDLLVALLKTEEMDMEKERDRVLRQFKEELSFEAIAKKINAVITSL